MQVNGALEKANLEHYTDVEEAAMVVYEGKIWYNTDDDTIKCYQNGAIRTVADNRILGSADGAIVMGTYTGSTITDNQTVKQNIQQLETKAELNTTNISSNDTDIANLKNICGSIGASSGSFGDHNWTTRGSSTVYTYDGLISLSGYIEVVRSAGQVECRLVLDSATSPTDGWNHSYLILASGTSGDQADCYWSTTAGSHTVLFQTKGASSATGSAKCSATITTE